ncbi:MAG: hypothetical protein JXQ85_09785 [Cognatishimia sp.]|uniref:hypothetical protein n=1 Tax=Cognatishimia sp. TaxID=2211648 RepID=UPI003B8D298D
MMVHVVSVVAFMVVTFAVQGGSHFVINKAHFAEIDIMRPQIIMPLGFLTMAIQASIISLALKQWQGAGVTLSHAMILSLAFGLFLASYMAFTEAAKFNVPSVPAWIVIELSTSVVQFLIFGVVLGLIHRAFA